MLAGRVSYQPCITVILWLAVQVAVSAVPLKQRKLTHSHRLLDDLFEQYSKDVRPVLNDSKPVEVTVHLWFKQVLKVDEIDQILTIYSWVEEYWLDEFLTWNPEDYGGVEVLHVPAERIWRPDIMVYNNADMNIRQNELTTNVVVNYTGNIMCFRAMITKITCNLDMTYFPFDQQNCSMMLASWSSDGSKIKLHAKFANNNLAYYIENTEWKLLDFYYRLQTSPYDCCPEPYYDVTFYFLLERNPQFYLLNLVTPSVFITVVTMVGFFTPYSSTGENTEKVSLGVTALLSLAIILLMVADKMPATSKVIPLIGKYYIGLIWLIFAATIITTVTLRLQSKGNAGKPLSPQTKRFFFKYIAKVLFMRLELTPGYQRVRRNEIAKHSPNMASNGGIGLAAYGANSRVKTTFRPKLALSNRLTPQFIENQMINEPLLHCEQQPASDRDSPVWRRSCDESYKEFLLMHRCLTDALLRVTESVMNIDDRLQWQASYEQIQQEWGQLARVVERLLMIVFIIGTILFAALVTVLAVPMPFVKFWG